VEGEKHKTKPSPSAGLKKTFSADRELINQNIMQGQANFPSVVLQDKQLISLYYCYYIDIDQTKT
jgi:hypothetical protein